MCRVGRVKPYVDAHAHAHRNQQSVRAFIVRIQDCWFVFLENNKRKAHDAPCRWIISEEFHL